MRTIIQAVVVSPVYVLSGRVYYEVVGRRWEWVDPSDLWNMERVQRSVRLVRDDDLKAEATAELLTASGYAVEINPLVQVD